MIRLDKSAIYPDRLPVDDERVPWEVPYPDYDPPYYVAPSVLEADSTKIEGGWADPESYDFAAAVFVSYENEGAVKKDSSGLPLNPRGRTGLTGRGLLGKWGANFAGDPIVTRTNPETGNLEMLAIQRKDNSQWAIPGGMVDFDEDIFETLRREVKEETGANINFEDAEIILRGYVDDPRNTDNAWMESTVAHKHLADEAASTLSPRAGSDAKRAEWKEVSEEFLDSMYASHGNFVRRAVATMHADRP